MKVEMYNGNEPYIFISYSHIDTDKVSPIVKRLDNDGYRLWYDEGIPTTVRFNNVIAERIDSCEFMLLFISDNYIVSDYCNSELNFAEQEKKKLICIYEKGVRLNPRFKMLKANVHGIDMSYCLNDEELFERLYLSIDIDVCLKAKNDKKNGVKIVNYLNGNVYEGEIKNGKKDGWGKYFFANGSIYEGEWKNDVRDGQGKMAHGDGDIYEGEWKNGRKNGKGKLTYLNGNLYVGEFKDDERSGKGKLTYANGDVYEGNWKKNKTNGQGKMIYDDGDIYDGEWKNNEINGKGKMIFSNGDIYEGEFKDGFRNGQGKFIYADGRVLEGEWKNGKFKNCKFQEEMLKVKAYQGNQPYIFISCSNMDMDKVMPIVERFYKDGYRVWYDEGITPIETWNNVIADRIIHCQMMFAFISNNYVDSSNCMDELYYARDCEKKILHIHVDKNVVLPKGVRMRLNRIQAIFRTDYANEDDFFEKLYLEEDILMCLKSENEKKPVSIANENAKIETVKYEDGAVYEGELIDGKRNGHGKMTYPFGGIYEGEWKNGMRNGHGKWRNSLSIYEGEWKDDTINGHGKMIFADGTVQEGEWEDGKFKN